MSETNILETAPVSGPIPAHGGAKSTSKKPQRPTSKDYAAEIQRLELERLKLQSQPISLPVTSTLLTHVPTRVESTGFTEVPTSGLSQISSRNILLCESTSTPELRLNLESIRTDQMKPRCPRSDENITPRYELKGEIENNQLLAVQDDRFQDVLEVGQFPSNLHTSKQHEQQAKEIPYIKQYFPSTTKYHQPTTSSTSPPSTTLRPPTLIIPVSTQGPTSPQASLQSLSPVLSSFTSVSPISSLTSGRMDESGREAKMKMVSSKPPANLEGQQRRSSADRSNEFYLQMRLDQSQSQVNQLKDRLKECNDICEQQKVHFQDSIAELQTRLKETVIGRNSVLDLRKKEAEGQEYLINQLQQTLKELEADYRIVQESSKESIYKIDTLEQNLSNTTTILNQINLLVTKEADNRGLTLLSESLLANQRPALVTTSLQQLMKHSNDELKEAKQTAVHCGKELEELKKEFSDYKFRESEEYRTKLNQLRDEHEKQMNIVTERSLNARQQASGLQAQIDVLQTQTQHQVEAKTKHINDLEQTIINLQQQMSEERKVLEEKCHSLNDELDDLSDHHRTVSKERDDLVSIVEGLEQEILDTKKSLNSADAEVIAKHSQSEYIQETLIQTQQKYTDLDNQLQQRSSEVKDLKKLLEETKEEAREQLQETLSSVIGEERQRSSELTTQLTSQVSSLTEKCTILSHELDQKESTIYTLKKHQDDVNSNTNDANKQLEMTKSEKNQIWKDLEAKTKDAEVIKQERDHYFVLLEERNKELGALRSQQETLLVQISERERQVMAFQEQHSNMTQLVELSSKSSDVMKEERVHLQQQLQECKLEVNSLKMAMNGVDERLKMKERKVEELELENGRLMNEIEVTMKEMERIIETKEKMLTELREAKMEVDAIAKDNERLRLDLVQNRRHHEKERNKLNNKLKSVEYELAVTTKAVQTSNNVDAKAVRVAESMQKKVTAKRGEIDSLQTRIHFLEECLDTAHKEKSSVIDDKDRLMMKFEKLKRQNEQLNTDVTSMMHKKKAQKAVVRKLESALEKAAVKHCEVQAYIETQEQDMTRLKLKHQLEIKELQRLSVSNTSKSHPAVTKAYYQVPASTVIPSIGSAPVVMETKTQAVQTNGQEERTKMYMEHAEKEYSLSRVLQKTSTKPDSTREVNQELKALLSEMKTVLHKAQQSGTPPSGVSSSGVSTLPSSNLITGLDPPIYTSSPYNSKLITATNNISGRLTAYTTTNDISGPLTAYTPTKLSMDAPPSPVANLLGRYSSDLSKTKQETSGSKDLAEGTKFSGIKMATAHQTKRTRHRRISDGSQVTEVASEEDVTSITSVLTPDLDSSMETQKRHIEQLEQQLKVLSQIGGQLQQENKEMATLIKSQDKKLKQCRKEERTIHTLVSTNSRH